MFYTNLNLDLVMPVLGNAFMINNSIRTAECITLISSPILPRGVSKSDN